MRARINRAQAADWRSWSLFGGFIGLLVGAASVGEFRNARAIPAFAVLGLMYGFLGWVMTRVFARFQHGRLARWGPDQPLPRLFLDVCLMFVFGLVALIAIAAGLAIVMVSLD